MCGADVRWAKTYSIEWNDATRSFFVQMSYECRPCNHRFQESVVKELPVLIQENSHCSCGGALALKSHVIRRTTDDELVFEGTYACSQCPTMTRSLVHDILTTVGRIWRDAGKIEIGLSGIKWEGPK